MREFVGAILLLFTFWPSLNQAQDLIVNEKVRIETMSQNQARLYFTQKLQLWPDGTPVQVFVLPDDNPLHRSFSKKILGLYPYQLRRVWDRMIFSGTGQAPRKVVNATNMVQGVASTPGAIGYAPTHSRHPGVKKVETD